MGATVTAVIYGELRIRGLCCAVCGEVKRERTGIPSASGLSSGTGVWRRGCRGT